MKPYKLILGLIALINLNTYSQSNFLHRKYTKGVFYEKFHKLKVVEKNNKAILKIAKNNTEVKNEIVKCEVENTEELILIAEKIKTEVKGVILEQNSEVFQDSAINNKTAFISLDSLKPKYSLSKKTKIDNENHIIKHNTIVIRDNEAYCSLSKTIKKSNANLDLNSQKLNSNPDPGIFGGDGGLFEFGLLEGLGSILIAILIIAVIIGAIVFIAQYGIAQFLLLLLVLPLIVVLFILSNSDISDFTNLF